MPCVVAGSIAKQILSSYNISISSYVTQIGEARSEAFSAEEIMSILDDVKKEKDSVGAVVRVEVDNVPVGTFLIRSDIFGGKLSSDKFTENVTIIYSYDVKLSSLPSMLTPPI